MKKKQEILVFAGLCFFNLCVWGSSVWNLPATPVVIQEDVVPHGWDEIVLEGTLLLGVGPNSIEAGASDDAVYIGFNQSFGNVSISIYNGNGQQVYSTVVDTSVQQVVIIPFTTAAADTYTVELSHADNYAEGEFEKN